MLISPEYLAEQKALHARGNYGTASLKFGQLVSNIIRKTGAQTLLDYGCGSMQNLRKVLSEPIDYRGYEPAVPEYAATPEGADLVVCIDVLEHIEPNCLDDVLADLRRCTEAFGFFTVHTGPAMKTLSDGRNAHLIQQPLEWWLPKFHAFTVQTMQRTPDGFYLVVT